MGKAAQVAGINASLVVSDVIGAELSTSRPIKMRHGRAPAACKQPRPIRDAPVQFAIFLEMCFCRGMHRLKNARLFWKSRFRGRNVASLIQIWEGAGSSVGKYGKLRTRGGNQAKVSKFLRDCPCFHSIFSPL